MKTISVMFTDIKENIGEYYLLVLIVIGLPLVAYIYVDWKLALSVFIVSQIAIGLLALRKTK